MNLQAVWKRPEGPVPTSATRPGDLRLRAIHAGGWTSLLWAVRDALELGTACKGFSDNVSGRSRMLYTWDGFDGRVVILAFWTYGRYASECQAQIGDCSDLRALGLNL